MSNKGVSASMFVPTSNLKAQYLSIRQEIDRALARLLDRGEFDHGEEVASLESSLAQYCQTRHAVGVGSGYAALFLALKACDIGPGDEVISVPNTDLATISAITHTGAESVLVDVDPHTYNIDPRLIPAAITSSTRAIMPVHLYGLPADMDPILEIARQHNLLVIEDGAIALGAEYRGRRVGSMGHLGCFSFAPRKMLGAYGDCGLVTTDDAGLAARVRLWGSYGERRQSRQVGAVTLPEPRDHEVHGYHSHLVTLQAAILNAKLPFLEGWIARRREIAARYDLALQGTSAVAPHVPEGCRHVYRNYVIRVSNRDRVRDQLAELGIQTDVLYAPPVHLQTVYRQGRHRRGDLPSAELLATELLALPVVPELTDAQVEHVAESLRAVTAR